MPSIEDQLSQALRRTADTFDNDSQYLAGAGLARGRALRRRRAAVVAAGTSALAATGVTAVLLAPPGGAATEATPAAGGRPAATAPRTAEGGPVSAARMLALFKALLPEGTTSGDQARGLDDDLAAPFAQVVLDDGHGAAQVSVALSRQTPGENNDGTTRCPDRTFIPYDECTRTTLAGGTVLLVVKGYEYPDKRVDTKLWTATATATDGRQVQAMEWNAPAEKDAAVTRQDPPLDAARLKTLVTSATWDSVLDRIPALKAPESSSADPAMSGQDDQAVMVTARSLLPKNFTVEVPPDPPIPYLVIDDGKGESYLEIDRQQWKPGDLQDDVFADATALPDGIQVVVRKGASEKGGSGAVTWIVDTMRPDGLRVVLTELNAPGWHQDASRAEPPLTIAQLKAMALNDAWKKLR